MARLVPGKQCMIRGNLADRRGMIPWIANIVVICAVRLVASSVPYFVPCMLQDSASGA